MTNTSTATTNFGNQVTAYIRAAAESELRRNLPWADPSNAFVVGQYPPDTNCMVFKRYADPTPTLATRTLTEGTMPTPSAIPIDSESMTFTQYGNVLGLTDVAAGEVPSLGSVHADKCARDAALTIDLAAQAAFIAGTKVVYSGTATSRLTLDTAISWALVRKTVAKMRKAAVPTFPDGTYKGIFTIEQIATLRAETTKGAFIEASLYAGSRQLMTGEVGMVEGVRIIDPTSAGKIVTAGASASADAHIGVIFGPEAIGSGDFQRLQTYYKAAGGDHSDLLAQQYLYGWKWAGGFLCLSKAGERVYRVESVETTL